VEEYINKGDVLQHCIARPELYSEAYVANTILRPLLDTLAYLHGQGIIHRWVAVGDGRGRGG
jgi:serine/threonine protein kinase